MKNILTAVAICAVASQGLAGIVYSEDFEGGTANVTTTADLGYTGGGAGSYSVRDFGEAFGTANKWLQTQGFGNPWTWVDRNGVGSYSVASLSLDFHLSGDSGGISDGYLRIALKQATGNAGFADLGLGNFSGAISSNTTYHLDMVANNTGASVNYNGGVIDDGTLDVWIDGTLVVDGAAMLGTGNLTGFGLWMNNGGTVDTPVDAAWIDNIEMRDNAYAVPEPASIGLIGLFGGGMLFIRRRLMI